MIILHGENTVLSRQKLKEEIETLRARNKEEVLKFEGNNLKLNELQEAIEAPSLLEKII